MSNEKDIDGTQETENEEVEGYAKCTTHKQKCLTDCPFSNPVLSQIN